MTRTVVGLIVFMAILFPAPSAAESLAGTDGNPPSGCRKYSIAGRAWAATGCPNGASTRTPEPRPRQNPSQQGQLEVTARCTSTPEETIIRNTGRTDVFVERITSPDTGQDERPLDYDIGQTIRRGAELVIETGSGAPEGFRNEIYRNEDVDIEEVIVETDAGDFVGTCVEAEE